jgi:uncharacterized protein (TIGR02145 family)
MRIRRKFDRLPILLLGVLFFFAGGCSKDNESGNNTYKDPRDGKIYKTVKIGSQIWMAENLAYAPATGNYWAYDNDNANVEIYGYLYDWQTAVNVCPAGWHLPSDEEWSQLTDYLGGESVAGDKLKATTLWDSPNIGATNETGFTALPGTYRSINGTFGSIGKNGNWWSATEYDASLAWARGMFNTVGNVVRDGSFKEIGYSVRCLRD